MKHWAGLKSLLWIQDESMRGIAFKKAFYRDICALSPHICAKIGLLWDKSTHFNRFECLLPHIKPAF